MKFEINRDLLDSTLQNVSKGLSNKTPMPVLMGILIIAEKDKLIFITTNKEISIKIELPTSENLKIAETGSCVIRGKCFADIVKKIDGKKIEFTVFEESTIKIISEKSEFTIVAYDKNDFPQTNFDTDNNNFIKLQSKELKQIIKQTSFACSTSENRIILTSVNFFLKNNELNVIATDSFRLAKRTKSLDFFSDNVQINIPSKSLEDLIKILPDSSEEIELFIYNNKALFKINNICFLTRLVQGNYPDTSSLFPKNFLLSIVFNKNEIISAVDRASLLSEADNLSIVKLNLFSNKENIEISSNSTEIGRVVEEILPIKVSEKLDFQIAFSAKYLMEALKSFDSEEITIYFTGEIKPAIITSDKCANLTQLLLPVRVF